MNRLVYILFLAILISPQIVSAQPMSIPHKSDIVQSHGPDIPSEGPAPMFRGASPRLESTKIQEVAKTVENLELAIAYIDCIHHYLLIPTAGHPVPDVKDGDVSKCSCGNKCRDALLKSDYNAYLLHLLDILLNSKNKSEKELSSIVDKRK